MNGKQKGSYDWRKQLVELGTLIRSDGTVRCPRPNLELERRAFAKTCDSAGKSTIAFYNNGWNVFMYEDCSSALTYYSKPWKWIFYRHFCAPRYVTVGMSMEQSCNVGVFIRTYGHRNRCAFISIGTPGTTTIPVKFRNFQIPQGCILFVAVKKLEVPKSLIVFQPLPAKLVTPNPGNILLYDF